MISRRSFIGAGSALLAVTGYATVAKEEKKEVMQGFDENFAGKLSGSEWKPFSDKKVRVGIAGEGVCNFGSAFAYQTHPNVEVVAVTDLDPVKCKQLQERTKAKKTYPSCEELIKNAAADKIEALYIATDAPSHAKLAIMALEHGLNVASAVPAFFGKDQLELVPKIVEAAKKSGKLYMMNETTAFRPECVAMRALFEGGAIGKHVYTEGEYFHYWGQNGIPSYNGWRHGLPPQYYPTHSNGFYTCSTHGSFTEVSCIGITSDLPDFKDAKNPHKNPFGSEVALFKTSDGGAARMAVMWDAPGYHGETGRINGSPPENVTPPQDCAIMSALRRSSSASASAVQSRPQTTFPPPFLTIVSISGDCPSGLWHHAQRSGQPLKNTVVRTPGPSCRVNSLISNIRPVRVPPSL